MALFASNFTGTSNLRAEFTLSGQIRARFAAKFTLKFYLAVAKFCRNKAARYKSNLSQNASRKAVNLSPKCSNLQNKEQAHSKSKQRES